MLVHWRHGRRATSGATEPSGTERSCASVRRLEDESASLTEERLREPVTRQRNGDETNKRSGGNHEKVDQLRNRRTRNKP